jgi:hypothetical protein
MTLSPKALSLLVELFSEKSNLQLPVGVAEQVVEIRAWAAEQIKEEAPKN